MKAKFDFDRVAVQGVGSGVLGAILTVAALIMGENKILLPESETVIDSALPFILGIALLIVAAICLSMWFGSIFIEAWLDKRRATKQMKGGP